jgi:hypothetical protein
VGLNLILLVLPVLAFFGSRGVQATSTATYAALVVATTIVRFPTQ